MVCVRADRFERVPIAVPERSVAVPSEVVPSLKITMPDGNPEVTGLTVAVKVTVRP